MRDSEAGMAGAVPKLRDPHPGVHLHGLVAQVHRFGNIVMTRAGA